jgi:cytochrome c oxidase subunit 2
MQKASAAGKVAPSGKHGTLVAAAHAQDAKPQEPAAAPAPAAPVDPLYARGDTLFRTKGGCIGCHSLQATPAPTTLAGLLGPNLANVGARTWIGAGTLRNTDENLARWIHNPQAIKVGVGMPKLGLSEDEARALAAFLRAHQ